MSKQNQRGGQQGNNPDPQKKRNSQADSFNEEVKETEELFADTDTDVNEEDEFDFIFDDFDDDDEDADYTPEDEDDTVSGEFADGDDAYSEDYGESGDYPEEEAGEEAYAEEPEAYDEGEYSEEAYDEETYGDEEPYDEEAYAEDGYQEEDGEEEYSESDEDAQKPSLLFRITNPFRKLIHSLSAEPEYPEDEDEDFYADDDETQERAADPFEDEDAEPEAESYGEESGEEAYTEEEPEEYAEDASDADDFFSEDEPETEEYAADGQESDDIAAEESEEELAKTKQRKLTWKNAVKEPEEPAFDETDDFSDDYDNEVYDGEDYDEADAENEDDFGGKAAGFALRSPFRKKNRRGNDQSDEPEDVSEPAADYDDDEIAEEGGFDYGKIALILTFVILGIFAIDFCRRVWDRWHRDKDMLSIQSSVSSELESVTDSIPDVAEQTQTTTLSQDTVTSTTSSTVIFTSPVSDTSDNGGANVETRETSVLTVNNDELHRGSVVLIDADHQQTFNPSLVTFADMKVPHLRFTSTYLQYDSSMAEDLKRWIGDFFAATGHGNIMVYSTNQQPQKAVSAVVPYGIQIPERSTGLTLDLAILDEVKKTHTPYTPDGDYAWLNEHAAEYGFILRYPEGKNDQTGLEGKTWHFRYVGIPHALYMKENDLTLEEYLEKISVHTWEKEHLTATAGGVTYEMYYVPASETEATTDIQYPVGGATPVVSGDNIEGFVVSCVKQ